MAEQDTKKQTDTEFVCKLIDMIQVPPLLNQKYPQIINWTNDGEKMIIFNISDMESLVLPQYFRHSNFSSFIRQNQITFKNDLFVRGNEKNFHFIQRKKRIKQQSLQTKEFQKKSESILKRLYDETKIDEQSKEVIQLMFEYKYCAYENTKKIRVQLDNVVKQLKDCRSKKITETLKLIRNHLIDSMTQQLKMSKDIDILIDNRFLLDKQKEKQSREVLGNVGNFFTSHFHLPGFGSDKMEMKDLFYDCNKMRSRPSFMALQSNCHIWSVNDFQPILLSSPKVLSDANFDYDLNPQSKAVETSLILNGEEEDDELSMGRMDEDELKQILKGEEEGATIQNEYGRLTE